MEPFIRQMEKKGVEAPRDERTLRIIKTLQKRSVTLGEMASGALFYFREHVEYDEKAARKFLTAEKTAPFGALIEGLEGLGEFTEGNIEGVFREILETTGLKLGRLAQPVRVALTGGTISPGIYETIWAMGRDMTIRRLKEALAFVEAKEGAGA